MIYVIGIGPGHPDYLLPAAVNAADKCQVLAGGKRALALFPNPKWDKYLVTGDLQNFKHYLNKSLAAGGNIGILVSGDPGFFSLLPFIKNNFPAEKLEIIPGISSVQFAFARAGIPWQGARLSSAHGRPLDQIDPDPHTLLGTLTGKENSPQAIAAYLLAHGPNRKAWVGDNLSYAGECWRETTLESLAKDGQSYLNAVLIVLPVEGA